MATFDTSNQNFRRIMGNGVQYSVPRFQRDYAWGEEQWEDLWNDLTDPEREAQHYMGYLVLQQGESPRQFSIIDGQQRLTTITIIIIAVLRNLKALVATDVEAENNSRRLEFFRSSFVGAENPVSLQVEPKLRLNRNNERYFERFVCRLGDMPVVQVNRSSRRLRDAVLFFESRLEDRSGTQLAEFVEDMIDALLFTTIEVGNDLNAYRVFETLNARGVQLSVPDLLKNFLFSMIDRAGELHDTELDELETSWVEITSALGANEFPRFVRSEWNSRRPSVSKFSLFKRIKRDVTDRASAHEYLRRLRESVDVYAALQDPASEQWRLPGFEGATAHLTALRLFGIRQPDPMLLAAFLKFSPPDWTKILGYVVTISIRFKVIGRKPGNEQEPIYNDLAQKIASEDIRGLQQVKLGLRAMYPTDEQFCADFRSYSVPTERTHKKARWILAELERQNDPDAAPAADELTLEHVLPKNPNQDWRRNLTEEPWSESVHALGNMTILSGEALLADLACRRWRIEFR